MRKKRPDATAFAPLPRSIFNRFTWPKHNIRALAASRLLSGCHWSDAEYELAGQVRRGETWASLDTLAEDISAATGEVHSRSKVRYHVRQLEGELWESRMVRSGHYGKIYTLAPDLLQFDHDSVDVVRTFRLYAYGDPSEFTEGEIIVGDYRTQRGGYGNAERWSDYVALHGLDDAAYTTVGRWRRGEEGNNSVPVFLPWIVIDLDRTLLLYAYEDAQRIVDNLLNDGFDLSSVIVSFSGRKGFHIEISTEQIGSPIFRDSKAAKLMVAEILDRIRGDVEVDRTLLSPRQPVRLTGSIHDETGLRKRSWLGEEFLGLSMQEALSTDYDFASFERAQARRCDAQDLPREMFEQGHAVAVERYLTPPTYGSAMGPTMNRIMEGISESEQWHEKHVGRNIAGYILSCWIHESKEQHLQVQERLGISTSATWDTMQAWNQLNSPPMCNSELRGTYRRGKRTVC